MKSKEVIAIVQARMGSKRLPGKTMLPICGTPMIGVLLERLSKCKSLNKIVVATTNERSDDVLEGYLVENSKTPVFRGAQNDLLARYFECATLHNANVIVRITADDPLKDPTIVDYAVEHFLSSQPLDYISNCLTASFPEGLDVEVFSYAALKNAHENATLRSEREHLTPYIVNNPKLFSLKNFECHEDLSSWRWTVDKPNDYIFIKNIFEKFYPEFGFHFSYLDVIEYIKSNPSLLKINSGTVRFEGYLKSLETDGEYGE